MSEDIDLQQMFQATREIDEAMAPSFDELKAMQPVESEARPLTVDPGPKSSPISVALSAIAAYVVVGISFWIYARLTETPQRSVSPHEQMVKLDQICDSLLATLDQSEFEPEMEWPTETDTLIPFETLSFHTRTSP